MSASIPALHADEMTALRHVMRNRRGALAALAESERDDLMRQIMDEDRELLAALAKGEPSPEWQKDKARG